VLDSSAPTGHELADVQRFVEWGFDFLKYDWCSYTQQLPPAPTLEDMQKPYWLISKCLAAQQRDIVLNLCQYGMSDVWEWGGKFGQSWRTAGDLGLSFERIANQIIQTASALMENNLSTNQGSSTILITFCSAF